MEAERDGQKASSAGAMARLPRRSRSLREKLQEADDGAVSACGSAPHGVQQRQNQDVTPSRVQTPKKLKVVTSKGRTGDNSFQAPRADQHVFSHEGDEEEDVMELQEEDGEEEEEMAAIAGCGRAWKTEYVEQSTSRNPARQQHVLGIDFGAERSPGS